MLSEDRTIIYQQINIFSSLSVEKNCFFFEFRDHRPDFKRKKAADVFRAAAILFNGDYQILPRRTIAKAITKIATVSTIPRTIS